MKLFHKFECIKQHDEKDCGIACLATILKHYKIESKYSEIRNISQTDVQGTSVWGLVKAAKYFGFNARGVKTPNPQDIYSEFIKPAIALIVVDKSYSHYVVIHKVSQEEIVIADPAKGIIKYKPADFFDIWQGVLILLEPTTNLKKSKKERSIFNYFLSIFKAQNKLLIKIILTSIMVNLIGIIIAFYYSIVIDSIIASSKVKVLFVSAIFMIIISVSKVIIEFYRKQLINYMCKRLDITILLGYFKHIIKLPMNFFSSRDSGDILSRFNDGGTIRETISTSILSILVDISTAIMGIIVLFKLNSTLFWISSIPICIYIILMFAFKNRIKESNSKLIEKNAIVLSSLLQSFEGIQTIKTLNVEDAFKERMEKNYIKFIKAVYKYNYINVICNFCRNNIQYVFRIFYFYISASLYMEGKLTLGTIISFNALIVYYVDPIDRIFRCQSDIQNAIVVLERLTEILDVEKENEESKKTITSFKGKIDVSEVDFSYGNRAYVLKNISFSIKPGEKVAIVGSSGSGKSTIAKLLMKFHSLNKGEIKIDDINIEEIDTRLLRDNIAYISQDAFFFSKTIKENLMMVNKDCTYEDIIDACKKAKIHDFINSLSERYDTVLVENGNNISAGQKQRLAIARALLKKANILIMDEAISNLDFITERLLSDTLNDNINGITKIVISHRLSSIKSFDKIIVINEGSISEVGTHEQLMEARGQYYTMWNAQEDEIELEEDKCI